MKNADRIARAAGCITLLAALGACSKKEAIPSAPAAVREEKALLAADQAVEAKPAAMPAPMQDMARAAAPPPPPAAEPAVTSVSTRQQLASSAATYTDGERKFIRTANARFGVKDVYAAALGIEDTVGSHGGFVVKNDIRAENVSVQQHPIGNGKLMELKEYAVKSHLIVRVPSAKTQDFLRAIAGHVVFLDERNFAARDAQFDLLRQQLEMIRNQETQNDLGQAIREGGRLMQKTDAIATRNETKAARDAAHVEKKQFEDQVAFSTIELTLYQPSRVLQSERVDIDSMYRELRPGFFSRLGGQLRGGWEGLLEGLLMLAGAWPAVVIAGAAGALLWRFKRRARKTSTA